MRSTASSSCCWRCGCTSTRGHVSPPAARRTECASALQAVARSADLRRVTGHHDWVPPSDPWQQYAPRRSETLPWPMVALVVLSVISLALGAIGPARHHASAARAAAPAADVAAGSGSTGLVSALTTRDRSPDGTVVTPAMAAKVVRTFWPHHENALVSRNLAQLRRLSAGPERRWEQASVSCGCVRVAAARPLLGASYFVPRQTSFPASFVAEVKTAYPNGQLERQVLVFTKRAPGTPWLNTQMSLSTATPGTSVTLEKPVEDGSGYDEPATGVQPRRAQTIAARFAAMWQRAKVTGVVPAQTEFFITAKGRARLEELARYPQDQTQASGVLGHFLFSTSPADPLVEV